MSADEANKSEGGDTPFDEYGDVVMKKPGAKMPDHYETPKKEVQSPMKETPKAPMKAMKAPKPKAAKTPMKVMKAPKTKAAAKAKSKAAAKAKAKGKGMKKPSASGASSKSKEALPTYEQVIEEEEEEAMDDDEPVSSQDCFDVEDTVKDRSKWNKFKKLLDQGSLPDFITKAYEAANQLKTGKEKAIRQIVNNVLDRDPKTGSLAINLKNPQLKGFKVG